jgi:hypothetical protein
MTGLEYLTDYEKRCLNDSAKVIQKSYPLVSLNQIRDDIEAMKLLAIPWEQARFRRFLSKIRSLVFRF